MGVTIQPPKNGIMVIKIPTGITMKMAKRARETRMNVLVNIMRPLRTLAKIHQDITKFAIPHGRPKKNIMVV